MTSPRLSPTATLVLAVLLEQPMHPYEMLVRLRKRRDDRLVRLNPGAVYHAVDRLERDGLVERAGVDRDGNRPERTLYAITPAGVAAHDARTRDLVRETPREYPAFPVGLALVHDLPREDALALLRERRAALAAAIDGVRERLDDVVARGLPRRYLLDAHFELHQTQAEIAWLDATVADVTSGALSWTEEPGPAFRHSRTTSPQESS
ncbi:transcriptional regulator, PadR family [Cellulosimicrobium aquatile]|uniref:Transcriptional regulator, PadR family n=1 Tax=Cellulosimicrobium aquatile TaxID=1612203 RepID=A0A1N6T0D4_9MICO|nr:MULTISPECIES: helix-turn-helix transcriptional regulator [Cellulosimicrobium]MCM3534821.1 PadR family transcriptional regulator [Cellulosimicrobium funkei]QUB98115.1 helix-turn-helix transcriptional regulator [Cellulosimicrobium cellulans]SIQ46792.1 transcriptional regulator, PadR family [Cellulosimicrobium aquatile]